jgi:hypothetical protein
MRETGISPAQYEAAQNFENEEAINHIEYALEDAGLDSSKAPKVGTPAYRRLEEAAKSYIGKIDVINKRVTGMNLAQYEDERRKVHDQLCLMIYGKAFNQLTYVEHDKISNFAAYLDNRLDLVDKWH